MEELLFMLYVILVPLVHCHIDVYHFINMNLTWTEAQQFCRENFTDLATVESADDLNRMNIPADVVAWIGLHDDHAAWYRVMTSDSNSWRWTSTGTTSPGAFQYWDDKQPYFSNAKDVCGCMNKNGWNDCYCDANLKPVCYKVQFNTKQFFVENTCMTWAESLDYCRKHNLDLAMIENLAEYQAVVNLVDQKAWLGLYREPWTWSDNSSSSFRHWGEGEPNNGYGLEHCVTMASDLSWRDSNCDRRLPFICYETLPRHSAKRIKIQLQSTADLCDSSIKSQILNVLREQLNMKVTILNLKKTTSPKKKP